ncbi:MAG: flagellar hook-associated protein FlgK [Alphaproteobacteria bacterium]|nr:MAG: flagellar hook-associated protein FlgK [Alphaproteobacteria bacterium]
MSLTLAMRNALSGMNLNQFGLAVTSNNISNVNTPGYTRKIVQQMSRTANGIGGGVDIAGVTRRVNDGLARELRSQMSRMGLSNVQSTYLARVQDSFGTPGSANAINANIGRLAASFEALGATPQNTQTQADTVNDAVRMARQINSMATSTNNLRGQSDQEIGTTISRINELATQIDDLNDQIVQGINTTAGGSSVTDAQDRRDQAIRELAELVDVATYTRSDGRTMVTIGGYNLVGDTVQTVAYTPAAVVSPSTTFGAITIGGVGDLTSRVTNGKLKSLITLRDTTLPNYMAQLDTMALALRDRVNAVHNDGTCVPAQRTLTGTQSGLAAGTVFPASTGAVRIAITDATGAIVRVVDYNLPAVASTVGAVTTAINAALGPDGTCTINASGQIVIQATNAANGVAINENTGQVGATGQGLSQYFGLNDFFTGTDNPAVNGDLALSLAVNPTLVSNPGYISRGDLSLTAVVGENGVAPGDGSVAQRLAAVFTTQYSFSAVGGMPAMTNTIGNFSAALISFNASLASTANSDYDISQTTIDNLDKRIGSESGVSIDEEMSNMVVLENAYNASAQVIRTVNQMFDELTRILG